MSCEVVEAVSVDRPRSKRADWSRDDYMRRYPRICAHIICHSLGYATPACAANILRDGDRREENWCEWIYSCYGRNPLPAVQHAIRNRKGHRGYMSSYPQALACVVAELKGVFPHDALASWF